VLIETTDFKNTWSTVGVSDNVIEASWEALVDSFRYALLNCQKLPAAQEDRREQLGIVNH